MHGEQVHDALPQPQEEYAVVERTIALGLLQGAARIVQKTRSRSDAYPSSNPPNLPYPATATRTWRRSPSSPVQKGTP